ncbi:hypothetical protein CR513_32408, partial [Mucuna pruriens]
MGQVSALISDHPQCTKKNENLRKRKRERDDTLHPLEAACKAYFTLLVCMLLWVLEAALHIRPALSSSVHNQTGWKFEVQDRKVYADFSFKEWKIDSTQEVSFSDLHSPKHHGFSGSRKDNAWNWLPRTTSHDDYTRDDEYVTSVAATAFVIHSLEEAELRNLQKMRESPKSSRTQTMRREKNDISSRPSYGETSMKRSFGQDLRTNESAFPARRPSGISPPRSVSPAQGYQKQQRDPLQHKNVKTRPQTWEKAMIKMIQKQYEKMKSKILSRKCVKKAQVGRKESFPQFLARGGLEDKRRKESESEESGFEIKQLVNVMLAQTISFLTNYKLSSFKGIQCAS